MFDTFLYNKIDLSFDLSTLNHSDKTRLMALKFSQPLLFLAQKEHFKEASLNNFDRYIQNAQVEEFVQGYAYLVTNGFPKDFMYKSFDEIFAKAISWLEKETQADRRKRLAEIIHLILMNPTLNLSHKFLLNEPGDKGAHKEKTGIEHIFSMWVKSKEADKKPLAELLRHLIAITPDLTDITPGAKTHCFYALLSLIACAAVKRYLCTENYLSWTISLIDIIDIVPQALTWTTSLSAGYFMTLHSLDTWLNKDKPIKLAVDETHLLGTFAQGIPFVLRTPSIFKRVDLEFAPQADSTYENSYINRKLLLTKYSSLKAYMRDARLDIKLQLDLRGLCMQYEALSGPSELVFEGELAESFRGFARRTFNEANFEDIVNEMQDKEKREYFLKVYEMAEKGFISLDLQTMYVMTEVFNKVCYGKSHLVQGGKKNEDSLTFESFQFFFDTLHMIKEETSIPTTQHSSLLLKLASNNDSARMLLTLRGTKPNLKVLSHLWHGTLRAFSEQYAPNMPKEDLKEDSKPEQAQEFSISALTEGVVKNAKDSWNQVWNEKKGFFFTFQKYGMTFGFGFCIIVFSKNPLFKGCSLLGAVLYTTNYYYEPQITDVTLFTRKLYSDGYKIGNDVYTGIDSWKARVSKAVQKEEGSAPETNDPVAILQ